MDFSKLAPTLPKKFSRDWWLTLISCGPFAVSCVYFVWGLFHGLILPSEAWRAYAYAPSVGFAICIGLVTVKWIASDLDPLEVKGRPWKLFFVGLFMPLFNGLVAFPAAFGTVPMVSLWFAAAQQQVEYEVGNSRVSHKNCSQGVEFKGLPLSFNAACGVPDELRDKLKKGDRVVVTGQGNWFGMLPTSIRKLEEEG